jgi:O-antigen/teichoic acid export membrane protein
LSPTIKAFFLWQGLVSIATLAILATATYATLPRGDRGGRFSIEALRGVWRFAGGMVLITLLALLLTQVDKILLTKLLPLVEFGYYTLAATVAGALYMLISPITQAYYPRLCELHARGNQAELNKIYHQGAQVVSVIAGSAAIVMILFAENFLRLWTQDNYLAASVAPLLSLLTLGNLLNGLMWIPYQAQLAHGWTRLAVSVNTVAVLVLVPMILWVVPRHGAIGAAWIWVVLNAGYCLVAVQLMYRRILRQEKWRWYQQDVLAPLLSAGLVVFVIKQLWPSQEMLLAQLLAISIAATASLAASAMAARDIRRYLQRTFRLRLDMLNTKFLER